MSTSLRRASLLDAGIIGVSVTYGLLLTIAGFAGIFGILLMVLVYLSLWRYCYTLLHAFAYGHGRAPLPDGESANPVGEWTPLLHAALFMLSIFGLGPLLIARAETAGDVALAVAIALIGIAAFPASAAVLGVTRNIAAALNPVSIAHVIGVLRGTYFKLLAVLGGLLMFATILQWLGIVSSGIVGSFASAVFGIWVQLAAYALIGRAINDHADEFDLLDVSARLSQSDERDRDRSWQAALDRAYGSIRSGFVAEGYRAIRDLAESEGESLQIYQWLFDRMLVWEDHQHAVAIAPRYIERLLAAGRRHEALDVADQCRRVPGTRFELADGARAQLVEYARSVNRNLSADALERLGSAGADTFVAEQR